MSLLFWWHSVVPHASELDGFLQSDGNSVCLSSLLRSCQSVLVILARSREDPPARAFRLFVSCWFQSKGCAACTTPCGYVCILLSDAALQQLLACEVPRVAKCCQCRLHLTGFLAFSSV